MVAVFQEQASCENQTEADLVSEVVWLYFRHCHKSIQIQEKDTYIPPFNRRNI